MNAILISATYLSQFLIIFVGFLVLLLMIANVTGKIKKASKPMKILKSIESTAPEGSTKDFQLAHHELLLETDLNETKEKIKPIELI